MTIPHILFLPLAIGLFLIFLYFMARMFGGACGGREVCGRRFCPMGFLEDYKILFAGFGVGFLITGAVILAAVSLTLAAVSLTPAPYPGMDPLPPLPSQTLAIDGGNITISGSWGVEGKSPYYSVTCEGEKCYNATIYMIHRKEDLDYAVQNNLACPLHKTVAVINKTQPTYSSWFWPVEDQMLYPVVVLDDGTYVPFWDIRPVRWGL